MPAYSPEHRQIRPPITLLSGNMNGYTDNDEKVEGSGRRVANYPLLTTRYFHSNVNV